MSMQRQSDRASPVTRLPDGLEKLSRRLIPTSLIADPEARQKAITTSLFGFSMALWACVFAPVYLALGSPRCSVVIVIAGLCVIASTLSLKWHGSSRIASNLLAMIVLLTLLTLAVLSGGFTSPAMIWLPAVPMIAILLNDWRTGASWLLATAVSAMVIFLLDVQGVFPISDFQGRSQDWIYILSLVGIIACVTLLCFVFDFNARLLRKQLQAARGAAEQASNAKSEFLAQMSHEIRTPMNGVIGMLELLANTPVTQRQDEYIHLAKESAESLLRVLNDILDFSKIEAGRLELESIPFSLQQLIGDTLQTLEVRAAAKNLILANHISPEIPDALIGDPGRLRQVIVNLVGNAIKFTAAGEIVVRLDIVQQSDIRARVHFSVRDTGIGIPQDKQEQIFEAFGQADSSTTRHFGGTGLGLNISRQLIEKMGGRLELKSQVGEGAEFYFDVDFARDGVQSNASRDASASFQDVKSLAVDQSVAIKQTAANLAHILLAEDGLINQKVAVGLLEAKGHRVTIAQNGRQAIDALAKTKFDLILIDIEMPEMDGIEATVAIRENERGTGRRIPIVAMTAHALKGDEERFLNAGMDAHVAKPVDATQLYRVIDELVVAPADARPDPLIAEAAPGSAMEELVNQNPDSIGHESLAVVDWPAALEGLCDDRELLTQIIDTVIQEIPSLNHQLRDAIQNGDADTAKRLAHTLKGSASAIAALKTENLAGAIEQSIETNDLESAASQQAGLGKVIDEMIEACKEFSESQPS